MTDDIDRIIEEVLHSKPGTHVPLAGLPEDCRLFYVSDLRAVTEAAIKKGALDCNDRCLADNTVRDAAKTDARRELAREVKIESDKFVDDPVQGWLWLRSKLRAIDEEGE